MIKVKVQTILGLKQAIGQREIVISIPEGSSLSDLLSQMVDTWGESLSSRLFEPGTKKPLPYIRIMANGRDIAFLDGMETLLRDGDEVVLFPPVSGG